MKKITIKLLALFMGIAMVVLAMPGQAIAEDEAPIDGGPPVGRSLFDFLVTEKVDGQPMYEVPFPFENLITHLVAKQNGVRVEDAADLPRPQIVLIPNGRSVQKLNATLEHPRVVFGFADHPRRSHDVGTVLKDRLYVAYAETANQIEVISYNELAGRFEFQIVSDYREGGEKKVQYVKREFCGECHKAAGPIFARNFWDETNANTGVATAITKTNDEMEKYFGVKVVGNKGIPYDLDNSTDRAVRTPAIQKFWSQGCQNVAVQGYSSKDCRAKIFLRALAKTKRVFLEDLNPGYGDYKFMTDDQVLATFKANLTEADLQFGLGDLPNRNPSGFRISQLQTIPAERDRISLWKENMVASRQNIPSEMLPENQPAQPYPYRDDVDRHEQALDLVISYISSLITPSELRALPDGNSWNDTVLKGIAETVQNNRIRRKVFTDGPFIKGDTMLTVLPRMGVAKVNRKNPVSKCCTKTTDLPPVNTGHGGGGGNNGDAGLAAMNDYCYTACHGSFSGRRGFLRRDAEMSDSDLWLKIVKLQKDEVCKRLDWSLPEVELSEAERMPLAPHRRTFERAEAETEGPYPRQVIIDAMRARLLEFAQDPDAIAKLNEENNGTPFTEDKLQEYANSCNFQRVSGAN